MNKRWTLLALFLIATIVAVAYTRKSTMVITNWLRVEGYEIINDSLRVGSDVDFGTTTIGTDVFSSGSLVDSVSITGASTNDVYVLTAKATAATAAGKSTPLSWEAYSGKLIVHRPDTSEHALNYSWLRIK